MGRGGEQRHLLVVQRSGHAGEGHHRQHAMLQEAELPGIDVGAQQQSGGAHLTLRRGGTPLSLESSQCHDRGMLVELDVSRQSLAESTHQGGGLHQRGIGRVDGPRVVAGAEDRRQLIALQAPVGIVELLEQGLVVVEVLEPPLAHGALVLAGSGPAALDAVAPHQGLQVVHRGAVERQHLLLVGQVVALEVALVGQVDDEAGIAPRGALADPQGLQQHDAIMRAQLGDAPGRGQAGEAGTDHQPIGALA